MLNLAGTPYTDNGHSSMLAYEIEDSGYDQLHVWRLHWEELIDFPLGTYRFHIEGHSYDGAGTQAYSLDSGPFELQPSTRMVIHNASLTESEVVLGLSYASGPTNDDGQSAFEELKATGFLHHAGDVPPTLPFPVPTDGSVTVNVSITPTSGTPVELPATVVETRGSMPYRYVSARDSEGVESTAERSIATGIVTLEQAVYEGAGSYHLEVQVQDSLGNSGSLSQDLNVE